MCKLLTRQEFKEEVFKRDGYKCVVPGCEQEAVDAHHIMERKLFSDGGYYLNNGASLCSEHHLDAETGNISVKEILDYINIREEQYESLPYPDRINLDWASLTTIDYFGLIKTDSIDKWGNKKDEIESLNKKMNEWWKQYENKKSKKGVKEKE